MNILIVSHYFYPHVGGIEIVIYNQANELVKKGHRVTIVTSRQQNEKAQEIIAGIRVLRVDALNFLERLFDVPYPIFSPRLITLLYKEIPRHDVVHVHGALYAGSFISALFAMWYRRSIVLTEHVGFVPYSSGFLSHVQQLAFHSIGKIVIRSAATIFVLNQSIQRYIQSIAGKPSAILLNGVDTQLFHPVPQSTQRVLRKKYALHPIRNIVLSVGRFVEKKNIHLLIQVKKRNFDLILAGNGQLPSMHHVEGIHIFRNVSQKRLQNSIRLPMFLLCRRRGKGSLYLYKRRWHHSCRSLPPVFPPTPVYWLMAQSAISNPQRINSPLRYSRCSRTLT